MKKMKKLLLICCLFFGITDVSRAQAPTSGTNPRDKAKGLQKQLNLSDKQSEKVYAIYKESVAEFDKIKAKEKGNTDKMLADVKPLRMVTIKKIKGVLTPAQTVKYDKLLKESKSSSLNGGWSDGWSSTN
jgi:protein CpxP